MADEERVKGQQTNGQQRYAPIKDTCEQEVEYGQSQRSSQDDGDAPPGKERGQVSECLSVLRGQPGHTANPIQVDGAFGRSQ